MFCKYCGKEIAEDAKFCPNCGSGVNQENTPAPVQLSVDSNPPKQNHGDKVILIICAIFGLVLGILSIVFFWDRLIIILTCIPGIIMSCIGIKSKTFKAAAIIGLVFSIIGTIMACFALLLYNTVVIGYLL